MGPSSRTQTAAVRIALALHVVPLARSQVLDLKVEGGGSFSIAHNGVTWLEGGETMVGEYSSASGSLALLGASTSAGVDELGSFRAQTLRWGKKADSPNEVLVETSFRTYPADKGVIVFEQHFPSAVSLGAPSDGRRLSSSTLFPAFRRGEKGHLDALDCFSYHGVFAAMRRCKVGNYSESWQGGTPLAIYNSSDASLPVLVLAPLTFPKAQHMASSKNMFGVGVKGNVSEIPAGWRQLVMLSAGAGIRDGMMAWGDRVLRHWKKPRADMYAGEVLRTIGFWTDNGGYYHYRTGLQNETYEKVLPKVKAYHDSIGVPFGHWQFDSWFYPKDGVVHRGGGGGGVTNWTADPAIFPHGMTSIQSQIGLPMVMHNRQWSPTSDYIHDQSLGFEWYISELAAVPKDPPAFFKWFFTQQEGWGLEMYEQDWMCTEYDHVEALQTNISLADLWLEGMATGAASSNRTVQYCMPYAYDVLSGAAYPAVTNARASQDYVSPDQWAVGSTALFYWPLGILPFKDGFYSSDLPQVGGETVGPERNPDREALMATLSCATVGPMDGIYLMNASRIMHTCRSDGVVLKPDEPVFTAETCFRRRGEPGLCYVFRAHSDLQGLGRVRYHFNNDGSDPLTPDMVDIAGDPSGHAVYNWYTRELTMLGESTPLSPGYEGHVYAVVTPVVDGWIFVGEVDKYVTAAGIRFPRVATRTEGSTTLLEVHVAGAEGEHVKVCAAEAATMRVECKTARLAGRGKVEVVTFAPAAVVYA